MSPITAPKVTDTPRITIVASGKKIDSIPGKIKTIITMKGRATHILMELIATGRMPSDCDLYTTTERPYNAAPKRPITLPIRSSGVACISCAKIYSPKIVSEYAEYY